MASPRRVVVITQRVDPDDVVLGATVAKIAALARRVDDVTVLALSAVDGALPGNCRLHTFGARTQLERGARLEVALAGALRPRPLLVLAHMSPIFAVLAAPWCRPMRIPLVLWYTHPHASSTLRVAERAVNVVVSVDARSFPFPTTKLVPIGHGIDIEQFDCAPRAPGTGFRLLSLGRYGPVKQIETALRAVARVPDVELAHHGPILADGDRRYHDELVRLAADLGVAERAHLGPAVPRAAVTELLASSDALVNTTRAGSSDKVVFEAAAACLPVLASSPTFDALLPEQLRFADGDADALAGRIESLRTADRASIGAELRGRVEAQHSVDHWADELLRAAARPA